MIKTVPLIFALPTTTGTFFKRLKINREHSSAGSEHLPYKQRVLGSNPSAPTELKKGFRKLKPFFIFFTSLTCSPQNCIFFLACPTQHHQATCLPSLAWTYTRRCEHNRFSTLCSTRNFQKMPLQPPLIEVAQEFQHQVRKNRKQYDQELQQRIVFIILSFGVHDNRNGILSLKNQVRHHVV